MTLFAERAAAAVPGFALTEDNAGARWRGSATGSTGCRCRSNWRRPGCGRCRPSRSCERLTDRYALLTRGSRGAPTRQQTLRLCIDWSYELCTAGEQLVWGRLSVFAGSFELDAAEQVCGAGLTRTELLDTVTSLVEKSILIREEHGSVVRFRMLETLRDYGREKLQQTGEYSGNCVAGTGTGTRRWRSTRRPSGSVPANSTGSPG